MQITCRVDNHLITATVNEGIWQQHFTTTQIMLENCKEVKKMILGTIAEKKHK